MSVSYNRTNWKDYPSQDTPITADRLNNIEQGILDCAEAINDGTGGSTVNVDLTYSPESENAQSGIAVAQAVDGIADETKGYAEEAKIAQEKTELAQRTIESGSEFIFDGGGADNTLPIEYVVDDAISSVSENPLQNKVINEQLNTVGEKISTLDKRVDEILLKVYPVGSIYISVSGESPSALFGGTWQRIADGRALFGVSETDSDFYPGMFGGEKQITLSEQNLPHITGETATHYSGNAAGGYFKTENTNGCIKGLRESENYYRLSEAIEGSASYGGIKIEFGGDSDGNAVPVDTLPPYLAVYMWQRIS